MNKKIVFTATFLLLSVTCAYAVNFLMDRVVAIVNQEVITWSELYRMMELDANQQVKAMNEDERNRIFRENEAGYLETMINYRLQIQEAQTYGMKVSDEEIREAMDGIRKKFAMSDEQFQQSLKSEGYTLDDYRKRLYEQIIISKIVNQQVRSKILPSDQEIEIFMKEDKEFVAGGDSYRIRMIFLKQQKTDAENSAIEEKAKQIHESAVKGENFAELANKYSEDASRSSGGDLGFIEKGSLAREFVEALSTMKPGDISRPFRTSSGLYILKLEERSAPLPASDAKEEAKRQLSNKLFGRKYAAWIKSLRERSFIDIRL